MSDREMPSLLDEAGMNGWQPSALSERDCHALADAVADYTQACELSGNPFATSAMGSVSHEPAS